MESSLIIKNLYKVVSQHSRKYEWAVVIINSLTQLELPDRQTSTAFVLFNVSISDRKKSKIISIYKILQFPYSQGHKMCVMATVQSVCEAPRKV